MAAGVQTHHGHGDISPHTAELIVGLVTGSLPSPAPPSAGAPAAATAAAARAVLGPSNPDWNKQMTAADLHMCLARIRQHEASVRSRIASALDSHVEALLRVVPQARATAGEVRVLQGQLQGLMDSALAAAGEVADGAESSRMVGEGAELDRAEHSSSAAALPPPSALLACADVALQHAEEARACGVAAAEAYERVRALRGIAAVRRQLRVMVEAAAAGRLVDAARIGRRLRDALSESDDGEGRAREGQNVVGRSEVAGGGDQADREGEVDGAAAAAGAAAASDGGGKNRACRAVAVCRELVEQQWDELQGFLERAVAMLVSGDSAETSLTLRTRIQLARVADGGTATAAAASAPSSSSSLSAVSGEDRLSTPTEITLAEAVEGLEAVVGGAAAAWARVAEPVLLCVLLPLVREPTRHVHIGPAPPPATLSTVRSTCAPSVEAEGIGVVIKLEQTGHHNSEAEAMLLSQHLYPKLLRILCALWNHLAPVAPTSASSTPTQPATTTATHATSGKVEGREGARGSNRVEPTRTGGLRELWRLVWPRLADAIIAHHLSKAVPSETWQLAEFETIRQHTAAFEQSLRDHGFLPQNPHHPPATATAAAAAAAAGSGSAADAAGDLLMQYAANVDVHFAAKKRVRLLAAVRTLLLQADYSSSLVMSVGAEEDERRALLAACGIVLDRPSDTETKSHARKPTTGRGSTRVSAEARVGGSSDTFGKELSVFHWQPCHVSNAAQRLAALVRDTMLDACSSTDRTAMELYKAARDALTLFRALSSQQKGGQPHREDIPLLTALFHNDCLYLSQMLLTLGFELKSSLPQRLRGVAQFVDMVPMLRGMAATAMHAMLMVQQRQLMTALDGARGFANTDQSEQHRAAVRALKQVHHQLSQLASVLRPVLARQHFYRAMARVTEAALQRCCDDVLALKDISVDETVHLRKMFTGLLERLPPVLKWLTECPLPSTSASASSSVAEADAAGGDEGDGVTHLVPSLRKLHRLADILDMSLVAITQAWRSGDLSACGFNAAEVRHAIMAIFSETPLRKDCLAQI